MNTNVCLFFNFPSKYWPCTLCSGSQILKSQHSHEQWQFLFLTIVLERRCVVQAANYLPYEWLAFFFLETWYESLASGITNCKVMVPEVVREPIKIYMTYIFFEITPLRIDRPNFALSKWVIIQEIIENFNCHHFLYNPCNVHAALQFQVWQGEQQYLRE